MGVLPSAKPGEVRSEAVPRNDQEFRNYLRRNMSSTKNKPLPSAEERAKIAAQIIAENKGTDIKILDLREITRVFDFFVIASGTSRRQLHAISDEIDDRFEKEMGDRRRGIEGYQESRWIVLDYGDVVVHLFEPEKREFYALDELWGNAREIPFVPPAAAQ